MFVLNNSYYTLDKKAEFVKCAVESGKFKGNSKGIKYLDLACSFDIETSSFKELGEKRVVCYIWQFGLNGQVIIGRTLEEFVDFIKWLSVELKLNEKRRLMCFVHNLSYEFQFIRKYFVWLKTISNKERSPIMALSDIFVEFRCSYLLSGYNLETLAKNLTKYKVEKLVGNLDYDLIRHSETPLTDKEIAYCVNDVLVVMAYIQEEIERVGRLADLPTTKTGYVRRYVKKACMGRNKKDTSKWISYGRLMSKLTLNADSYTMLKQAFQGGFTHANATHVNKTLENVSSYDFTSSYPYVMLAEKFPMSAPTHVMPHSESEFAYYLKNFCCTIMVKFTDVISKVNESVLSVSKCLQVENPVVDNGRVTCADSLVTVMTETDYFIYRNCYSIANMEILKMDIYRKGYLPVDFVKAIIKLYKDKTELKGVEGKETEYLVSKGMLNSCYGMSVTDIVRDSFEYDNENSQWLTEKPNLEESIEKYNKKKGRFLFYAWGVWVTAYARYNLMKAILQLGTDYIYADTDSVKFFNLEKNQHIFDNYNREVEEKLKTVAQERGIDFNDFQPATIKGVRKLIGVFDYEGTYSKFKTLGAKRYLYEDKGGLHLTVAGVSKKQGVRYIENFDMFTYGLKFPAEYTGKLTHTYLDDSIEGTVTDYMGVPYSYKTLSGVHLEKTGYDMTITSEYEKYLESLGGIERYEI